MDAPALADEQGMAQLVLQIGYRLGDGLHRHELRLSSGRKAAQLTYRNDIFDLLNIQNQSRQEIVFFPIINYTNTQGERLRTTELSTKL